MAIKDLYLELSIYTKRPYQLVVERCKTAFIELAWAWEAAKADPIAYYRDSDLYIFDLTNYQNLLHQAGLHNYLANQISKFGIKKVLDFGGGIGEYTITTLGSGADSVDYLEIGGSKTLEYAQWRFQQHEVSPTILSETDEITGKYDLVIAMDVFEHIENPDPIIEHLAKQTTYLLCNPNVPYNEFYPQHISKVNLEQYFDKIDNDFWKSKL